MVNDKIYTVTTINWTGDRQRYRNRMVAWYPTLFDAQSCIEQNWGDIYERGHYNHAVIEETLSGLYPYVKEEYWYKWEGSEEEGGYLPCHKPEDFKCVVNFGIG